MNQDNQSILQKMAAARIWVIVAVILGVALVAYFAAQGGRYYQASEDKTSAKDEIRRLERLTRTQPGDTAQQEAQLVEDLIRLEDLHGLFTYPDTDTLLALMSIAGRDTGVTLRSISVSGAKSEPVGTLQYVVQPVSVSITGSSDNIQDFLATLQERVPVMAASSPSMSNLDSDPVSQLQLRFFLSPEAIPEEGG